ncbi:uncharacterized protein LOC110511049 isoform X2 [Oncorhynchus mykiss]|uniref:uncharacterized protein LOC110511049 isoform X2 n=1 Tax=Oncorhynchus mykiss TaxID=8022 RepID=UPI0018785CA9|nr:uncharacterized protein LOC110511049 isoform X2 [Oncorhynchus mykiss]
MCSSTRLTLKCWDLHLFPPQPDLSDTGGGRTSSLRWSGQLCDMDLSLLVAFCSCVPPALGSGFGREMPGSSIGRDMPASRMVEKDYDSAFHYGEWGMDQHGLTPLGVNVTLLRKYLGGQDGFAFSLHFSSSTGKQSLPLCCNTLLYPVFNYESLRIGGLIFAVVLFVMGIVLIVSQKCPCKSSPKSRPSGVPEAEAGVVTGPQ